MAGYSARQSSFTTGDTILAAHSNDEFNQVLAAFHATTGHSHDGTSGEGGPVTTLRDADALNKILVDTSNNHLEFYVEVSSAAVQQLRIQDGAIVPITDNDIDLGTSSLEFKDAFFDGTITTDALVADTADLNGGSVDGATLGTNSAITQAVIDNININGSTIGHTSDTDLLTLASGILTVAGEVSMTTLDIGGTNVTSTAAELNILDGVTSTAAELNILDGVTSTAAELNVLDGITAVVGELNALDIGSTAVGTAVASKAVILDSNKDYTGIRNLTISGDLTVTGDDITMGTNTAGNILVADGTNFNSIAVGGLSEISTVANDDVFLAVDTSGGGLKKIARSAVVAGLATSAAISNVVEDTTPQLGGDLDMNGADIVTTSNADLELAPNGTGHVTIKGNDNPGTIQFNCENNSHGQQLKPQPHSVGSSAVHTLPNVTGELMPGKIEGTNFTGSLLVGHATTGTLSSATNNTAVGLTALDALTSGIENTAVGFNAGGAITSGGRNVAIGRDALKTATTAATYSTAVGYYSMRDGVGGFGNTGIGYHTLRDVTGVDNIAIGANAGRNITSGSGNVIIGAYVDADAVDSARTLKITGYDGSTATNWISGDSSGNLTFAADVTLGDDLHLDSDASVLKFGDDGEITLTHVADTGLALKHTATADDKPIKLTLQTGETDIAANDVIGQINFQAPDEATGTDAILVAAGIAAISEGDFSSSNNATKLSFQTGASEAASEKMSLSSAGLLTITDDLIIGDGKTIGSASDPDAITIASNGQLTLTQTLIGTALDISGDIDIDGTSNLDVVDIDGAVDMASTLQVDGAITSSTGATITTADNTNTLSLVSTDADANSGPRISMRRESGSPADNDVIGQIFFTGKDDGGNNTDFASIKTIISDASDGTEDGQLEFLILKAGTQRSSMMLDSVETVFNEDSQDIDFRVESNAEANAFKIDGGSETASFGVPVTFNDAANVAQEAITSSSNAVAWDATDKPNAYHLTTENTTFSAPSNAVEGAFIALEINYNGSHTIAFNTIFEFAASTAPTFTSTDGKTDILVFRYNGSVWQEVGRTLNLSES